MHADESMDQSFDRPPADRRAILSFRDELQRDTFIRLWFRVHADDSVCEFSDWPMADEHTYLASRDELRPYFLGDEKVCSRFFYPHVVLRQNMIRL